MNSKDMAVKEVRHAEVEAVSHSGACMHGCCMACRRVCTQPACRPAAHACAHPPPSARQVKNGRLAMVAFVGFVVQAIATRTTPLEGLFAHIGSGGAKNITYYLTHLPETLAQ